MWRGKKSINRIIQYLNRKYCKSTNKMIENAHRINSKLALQFDPNQDNYPKYKEAIDNLTNYSNSCITILIILLGFLNSLFFIIFSIIS